MAKSPRTKKPSKKAAQPVEANGEIIKQLIAIVAQNLPAILSILSLFGIKAQAPTMNFATGQKVEATADTIAAVIAALKNLIPIAEEAYPAILALLAAFGIKVQTPAAS